MNSTGGVMAALILGAALVIAGFLAGGRYATIKTEETVQGGGSLFVYEMDRFTRRSKRAYVRSR